MRKVHILTPSYDGSCHIAMAWSILLESKILPNFNIGIEWDFYPGCCYPDIARNMLVKTFLDGNCEDALFIDTDVSWQPGAITRILQYDKDVVTGIYPYKIDEEKYPVQCEVDSNGRPIVDPNTGLILGKLLPTGFMRIRRNVFETLIDTLGDDLIIEDHKDPDNIITYYSFFDTPKIGKTKWGEDLHFCNVWRDMGGKVWICPDITFYHHGLKAFSGNFHDYLRNLPGGGGPPEKEWKFVPRI